VFAYTVGYTLDIQKFFSQEAISKLSLLWFTAQFQIWKVYSLKCLIFPQTFTTHSLIVNTEKN
jgi:hypothetical protein